MDPWHVQQVEPQTLIMEKIIMEKIIMEKIIMEKPVNTWFHRKNQLWKKWNYGKKKGSDHFRDILNPYGEKPNYGKIGRRRRLSKLNVFFFFHNSVGDHKPSPCGPGVHFGKQICFLESKHYVWFLKQKEKSYSDNVFLLAFVFGHTLW